MTGADGQQEIKSTFLEGGSTATPNGGAPKQYPKPRHKPG